MLRKIKKIALPLTMVGVLAAANFAMAHQWSNYHWDRYGSSVTVEQYNYASGQYYTEASQGINDWNNNTILYTPQVSYHTDQSVFEANSGDTGWAGLASIESWDGGAPHIGHIHAQVNTYYSSNYSWNQIQGIFCQEVGHGFGLDHSNDGGCMGQGYYAGAQYYTVSHNWNDIYNMYRYSHH